MDNEQVLINLYKQQQYNETHSRMQKLFMLISAVASIIGVIIMSLYFINWLDILVFSGMVLCVVISVALIRLKRLKLDTACYISALYAGFILVPVFWLLTGITGSAPYVSIIILVAIITLFSGKRLTWMLIGYLFVLAGLTVYSALIEIPKSQDIISLIYIIAAYSLATAGIVLYMLYKKREFDELNDKFLRSSFKDELTQLYNRKLLEIIIEYQETLYKKEKKDYILVMFDVDDFKKMNDEHGHIYGDIVLRTIGQCIRDKARASDFVVRYGGDEFLVIQTNASDTSIKAFIDRIETAMKTSCDLDTETSASFGFAARSECESPDAVLKLADGRLYEKKEARNAGRS